jgi:hypothetical protein
MTRAAIALAVVSGCSEAPAPLRPTVEAVLPVASEATVLAATAAPKPTTIQSARYVAGERFTDVGGGQRGAVAEARRVVVDDTGKARVVDPKPVDDLGRGHRIAEKLASGWLFIGDHTVRWAPEFDGALVTIASVPSTGGEMRVGVGHGRVLVSANAFPAALYEIGTGKPLKLDPKGMTDLFGAPNGMVAAIAGNGELFVSTKPGASFKKLPAAGRVNMLRYDGKGIVVDRDKDTLHLAPDGTLGPQPNEPGLIVASNVDAFMDPFPDMTAAPPKSSDLDGLLEATTRRMTADHAFAVRGDDLVFLDARTGAVTQTIPRAFDGKPNCFPVRGGTPSFVGCNAGAVTLLRIDGVGATPVVERVIPGTYTQDFGNPAPDTPLALYGRCDGVKSKGAMCVREGAERWRDVPAPPDPNGLLDKVPYWAHVAAAKDGSAYAFGWLDGGGDLIVIDIKAKKVRRIAKASIPSWAGSGVDWHGLTIQSGTLRSVLTSSKIKGDAGVVEIRQDDSIHAERLDGRVAVVGALALHATADGKLRESTDAGRTFVEVEPPPTGPVGREEILHCTEMGCLVGPWIRVGWGGAAR